MVRITEDYVLDGPKNLCELILEARTEAIRNGIKANSIVINSNLVKVPESYCEYPDMICGLKTHKTSCELPDDYIFSVLHDPRPVTNADRIRAMSDEELAEFLEGDYGNMEVGCALEWLKQPAEGE